MSKKIGFFSNINRGDAIPPAVTVFTVTAELSNVAYPDVPDTITFDIDSTLTPVANTVPVYWSTSGAANADFTDNVLSGNVLLDAQGNASVVRQITLVETGTDGNVTFEFRTGDPVIGNVIHTQTVDLSSERFAPFTRYQGANVAPAATIGNSLIYYNQFNSTNDQGELLYTDNEIRLELLPGDKLEISSIQSPTSNTEITDVEILSVNMGGTSGYYGTDISDYGNTSIQSQGGGPGGHVVHATNQRLVANTYIVVDRIYERNLSAYGKAETGLGTEFTTLNNVLGMGLIDTGIVQVYNTPESANASANVGDFAIILNTTSYPYYNTLSRYNGSAWVAPTIGAEREAARNALANALMVSRAWTPKMTTAGTDEFAGAGVDYYGSGNVSADGGGGGDASDTVQTTGIAPIVNNVIQTAFTSGTGSAVNNGAGGAGQGGNGSDPDSSTGGAGGAGYVSDIRGFGNVQYGAGGAGANGSNVGVTYSATNFRRFNRLTSEYETVTAHPPGTGQQGYGNVITRGTFNEYSPSENDLISNQGRIYLKWRDFRRFLTL